jgi:hypothetical protein
MVEDLGAHHLDRRCGANPGQLTCASKRCFHASLAKSYRIAG